jgi:hypothetical protein
MSYYDILMLIFFNHLSKCNFGIDLLYNSTASNVGIAYIAPFLVVVNAPTAFAKSSISSILLESTKFNFFPRLLILKSIAPRNASPAPVVSATLVS